ncbi:glycosyltransferase [Streptococcus suis]|uniref:glycosyltransferase n=1 Tax=Streptococcus suis TaxID=1307 RepID=UPI0019205227|nr:glycosyltransferase [Streptococcus suis]
MKKILFMVPSLSGGGAEKVLVNLVNNLNKKYDITVLTLFDVGVNKQFLNERVNYKFVFPRVFRGNRLLLQLASPEYLYKKMVKGDYDIVVSFFQSPTTRIIAGGNKQSTKFVQWIHNEFHDKQELLSCYRSEREFRRLQQKYDATIFVAETVKTSYESLFPRLVRHPQVLYNVIETDKIRRLSLEQVDADKSSNPQNLQLISVGRLVLQKGFERLIRIVSRLAKEGYSIELSLLGTGELHSELQRLIEAEEVDSIVHLLGYKENPYAYVKNADLFVCSSLHEGYSTAVTESLIVGTPVLTTDCSGMAELLGEQNEYGMIVENSETALYKGLKELLENPNKLANYRKMAEIRGQNFNQANQVLAIERMFDELSSNL